MPRCAARAWEICRAEKRSGPAPIPQPGHRGGHHGAIRPPRPRHPRGSIRRPLHRTSGPRTRHRHPDHPRNRDPLAELRVQRADQGRGGAAGERVIFFRFYLELTGLVVMFAAS
jgi:hypothetical protein